MFLLLIRVAIPRTFEIKSFSSAHDATQTSSLQVFVPFYIKLYDRSGMLQYKKVQLGNDQEKVQSERNSHSKNRGGRKQIDNYSCRYLSLESLQYVHSIQV